MPEFLLSFTLSMDGEIKVEADNLEAAKNKVRFMNPMDLAMNHNNVDDPYNEMSIDNVSLSEGDPNYFMDDDDAL